MNKDKIRPFVLYVAEVIYLKISEIKKKNKNFSNIDAFEKFINSKDFDEISSGKFHDKWFKQLNQNNFFDLQNGMKITNETFELLKIQRDSMIKQLIKIPRLYYVKNNFPLKISQRAFDHLWRICESYELWCKETNQINLINLNLVD
tara:strand:+ start:650 stop:1090 length:441 start_codon:yes stop_codon:yes gene_type:complete